MEFCGRVLIEGCRCQHWKPVGTQLSTHLSFQCTEQKVDYLVFQWFVIAFSAPCPNWDRLCTGLEIIELNIIADPNTVLPPILSAAEDELPVPASLRRLVHNAPFLDPYLHFYLRWHATTLEVSIDWSYCIWPLFHPGIASHKLKKKANLPWWDLELSWTSKSAKATWGPRVLSSAARLEGTSD